MDIIYRDSSKAIRKHESIEGWKEELVRIVNTIYKRSTLTTNNEYLAVNAHELLWVWKYRLFYEKFGKEEDINSKNEDFADIRSCFVIASLASDAFDYLEKHKVLKFNVSGRYYLLNPKYAQIQDRKLVAEIRAKYRKDVLAEHNTIFRTEDYVSIQGRHFPMFEAISFEVNNQKLLEFIGKRPFDLTESLECVIKTNNGYKGSIIIVPENMKCNSKFTIEINLKRNKNTLFKYVFNRSSNYLNALLAIMLEARRYPGKDPLSLTIAELNNSLKLAGLPRKISSSSTDNLMQALIRKLQDPKPPNKPADLKLLEKVLAKIFPRNSKGKSFRMFMSLNLQ